MLCNDTEPRLGNSRRCAVSEAEGRYRHGVDRQSNRARLSQEPNAVSPAVLVRLLSAAGNKLNVGRTMIVGLQRGVSSAAASRNLVASATLPSPWRRILAAVEKITQALSCRNQLDISIEATEAAAKLSWEFDAVTANGFMRASIAFLPFALDDGRKVLSLQSARAPLQPHCGRYQRVAKVRLLLNPVQCPEPGRGAGAGNIGQVQCYQQH
jgi:hypothetical protein